MPALSNFTVDDRESTPVAHTFSPDGGLAEGGGYAFAETAVGTPNARPRATIRQSKSRTRTRVRVTLFVPVMVTETINGVARQKQERYATAEAVLNFDDNSTLQERKNLVGEFHNMFASSQTFLNAVFTDLDGMW